MNDLDRDAIANKAVKDGKDWRGRALVVLPIVVAFVALGIAIWAFRTDAGNANDRADVATNAADHAAPVIDELRADCLAGRPLPKGLTCEQILAADEAIEDVPEPVEGIEGEQGDPGRPATPAEILAVVTENPEILDAAIRRHCATTDCRGVPGESLDLRDALAAFTLYCNTRMECIGPRGRQGLPGPGPTDEQLTAILVGYCSARNECIGGTGPQGDPGRAPTSEEIRTEVDAHCAEQPGGTCEGPQGDKGERGDTGPAGYPQSWTYTDQLGVTYVCTDPDNDHNYECEVA